MTIYQIRENGQLTEMKAQLWDSTASLKQLLTDNPSLLAGEQIDTIDPRRWLSISTELAVPSGVYDQERGVVDHLFVDQDAMPTLVQVVTSDGDNYGEVIVAKLLDYAAHAVTYWSIADLQDKFATYWRSRDRDSDAVLQDFLESGTEKEIFWQQVQYNLQQGRLRLVFVSDYVAPSFQHLVEFLNVQMDHAEVLAVEINKYTSDNLEIIVPKLIGVTTASQRKSITPRPGNQWDEDAFIYELKARKATDALGVAQRLLGWAKARKLHLHWGIGRMNGSFAIVHKQESVSYPLVTVGMNQLPNDLKIQFGVPIALTPFQKKEKRQELLQRFPKIQGMRIVEDAQSLSFFVSSRQAAVVLDQTFHVLDWIIHEISS